MRRIFTPVAAIVIVLAIGFVFNYYTEANSTPQVETNLRQYADRFGERFYKALFSLPETRPYSIIQFDATSEMYQNEWIPPEKLVGALEESDFDKLIRANAELIATKEEANQVRVIEKLHNWCLCDMQLNYINNWLGFSDRDLLRTARNNPKTRYLFTKFHQHGGFDISGLTELQQNEAYYEIVNTLADFEFDQQMNYWADTYSQLKILASAD
jgi:hypothetical protein